MEITIMCRMFVARLFRFLGLLSLLGCAWVACGAADFPLHDVPISQAVPLSGEWRFASDTGDVGVASEWYGVGYDRTAWQTVQVPGVLDYPPGEVSYPVKRGVYWYARTIQIPEQWDADVSVYFLGAMFVADVWANGEYLGVHRGGYSPFRIPLPASMRPGSAVELVVRVVNRLTDKMVPDRNIGWHAFGGLYREVYLVAQPRVRPEDLRTATGLSGAGVATFRVQFSMVNHGAEPWSGAVRVALNDSATAAVVVAVSTNCAVGEAVSLDCSLVVGKPRLWSVDEPNLYSLVVGWREGGAQREMTVPVGLREIRMVDGKVLLNGRRYWLQGFGQHEEQAGYGPCIPVEVRARQLSEMKRLFGCNTLRPGHYPNHPDLYDLCDRMGFLVFSEIPAWHIARTYMESDAAWNEWLAPQLREMAVTLRNHPSCAFWGVANEIGGTHKYFKRAIDYLKELDDTRSATVVLDALVDLESMRLVDMPARNLHYGWYHSQDVYALRDALTAALQAAGGKPLWVSELGALSQHGNYKGTYSDRSRGSEPYHDRVVRYGLQYVSTQSDSISGVSVWTWQDFHENKYACAHGIFTDTQKPKLTAYRVCNLYQGDLRLYICEANCVGALGEPFKASLRCFNPRELSCGGLTGKWRILRGASEVAAGELAFDLAGQRSCEVGTVSWEPGPDVLPGLYVLWVELFDADGSWRYTNWTQFDCGKPDAGKASDPSFLPGVLDLTVLDQGVPAAKAWALLSGIRLPVYEGLGLLLGLRGGSYPLRIVDGAGRERNCVAELVPGSATKLVVDLAVAGGGTGQ